MVAVWRVSNSSGPLIYGCFYAPFHYALEVYVSLPISLGQRPRIPSPFHGQLVHTCASPPHFAARACLLWVMINLGLCMWATHVLSRGFSLILNVLSIIAWYIIAWGSRAWLKHGTLTLGAPENG